MKCFLAGYEGSKHVISATSWLTRKYLSGGMDIYFLNFGKFDGILYDGEFVSLDEVQRGGSEAWGKYLSEYLAKLNDEFVIFGLDDYFLTGKFNNFAFESLMAEMRDDESIVSGRLCRTLDQGLETFFRKAGIVEVRSGSAYSVTAQWCVWRRAFLVDLLARVRTAWDFEIRGSEILGASGKRTVGTVNPVMSYPDESSLSAKWKGVRVQGVPAGDVDELVGVGALDRGVLC